MWRGAEEKARTTQETYCIVLLVGKVVFNTIRLQLGKAGNNCYWTEIVRTMSTQKLVTTEAVNALGEKVLIRMPSKPTAAVSKIYAALKYRDRPFWR